MDKLPQAKATRKTQEVRVVSISICGVEVYTPETGFCLQEEQKIILAKALLNPAPVLVGGAA